MDRTRHVFLSRISPSNCSFFFSFSLFNENSEPQPMSCTTTDRIGLRSETSLIRRFLAYIYIFIVVWVLIVVIHFVVVLMGVVVFVPVMVVVVAVVVVVDLLCVVLVASRLISNSLKFTSCLWVT